MISFQLQQDMRLVLREAFRQVIGREPCVSEVQCLQAISELESHHGRGWKPPGNGSYNLGAIQAHGSWHGDTFEYTDTAPQTDGSSRPYRQKFRKYPSLVEGAKDLVRLVFVTNGRASVLKAASEGNTLRFSAGLWCPPADPVLRKRWTAEVTEHFGIAPTYYYEGFGPTWRERIANHHKRVEASIRAQAAALKDELPADLRNKPAPLPTLRQGSTDRANVEGLQAALNIQGARPPLAVDGSFGPATARALRAFQSSHGLVPDGVCGPATWAKLIKD